MACRSISRSASGFTLLEVMLALAIFASLSLGAYQVLQGVLANDAITRDKGERLASLQRTFNQMERDFGQAVARPTRVEGEPNLTVFQAEPFQMQSDDWAVAWVRAGWLNPDGILPRSQLQKVGYRLKEGRLERLSYRYPDASVGTEPQVQSMLERVSGFKLRFYAGGRWRDSWENIEQLPEGVEVLLSLDDYGNLRRLFLLAAGSQP